MRIATAPAPSTEERYCAWFGDRAGDTLYAGLAPFWSSMRAADGDPLADLRAAGPQLIGRFDLAREVWREPLRVDRGEARRSGVWDVHVHDGSLVFTTFYEPAGIVDLETGRVRTFDAAGGALNEIAEGPDGRILVSRYGSGDASEGDGEIVALDETGRVVERWALPAPAGFRVAPKTPAWDPERGEIWSTTDLIATGLGAGSRHDAYRVSRTGAVRRIEAPELQFVAVTPDGRLHRVEVDDGGLWLRTSAPPSAVAAGAAAERRVLLDAEFPRPLDFAQDLKPAGEGRVIVTRWSGALHVVDAEGRVWTRRLPRLDGGGLYYTAVAHGDRICTTHCGEVTVVCVDAPWASAPGPPEPADE